MNRKFFIVFILLSLFLTGMPIGAKQILPIKPWLYLGPVSPDIIADKGQKDLSDYDFFDIEKLVPRKGESIKWYRGLNYRWKNFNNKVFVTNSPKVIYFAAYIDAKRWLETEFRLNTENKKIKLYLDGKDIISVKKDKSIVASLKLTNEKHLLIVKAVIDKGERFKFNPVFELDKPFKTKDFSVSISDKHRVNINNILNMTNINSIELSKNGKLVKISLSKVNQTDKKTIRWIEILSTSNGKTVFSSKNIGNVSGFKWLSSSEKFSFTKSVKGKASIFIHNLKNNTQRLLLKGIKDFSSYWWAPDNSFLIYSTSKQFGKDKDWDYIKELPLRAKDSGYKTALNLVYINKVKYGLGNVKAKLFDYKDNYDTVLISPDSKKIIFTKFINDYTHRPYKKLIVSMLNMNSGKIEEILNSYWINGIVWGPSSKRLLMTGGPSAFGGIGNNLKKGIIPNDYDGQVFLYDLSSKKASQVSKNFTPSINSVYWKTKNTVYLNVTDKSYKRLYSFDLKRKKYKKINTKTDVVLRLDFSKSIAVYSGSSTTKPPRLYRINLSSKSVSVLKDYNKNMFDNVHFGKCKDWTFKASSGRKIKGRLYYPVGFNKRKKYPCIVYYYGGTSPVTREYGGRYPKNWYAANGYIVYVLQPTGTVGFGQEASAVHVNDWGRVTSKEIIEGVKKLVKKHPYIDKIGSMGASYGGFLTQYLATQTDVISAFISHAGISALSSYWGVGDWGYLYSGVASAESFPWNRKDLYVGHSPLFMADRIKSPLLLLHGDVDNNVPPGESYQMYAALKLAGKKSALITFKGQQHFILEYPKRVQWMRTIIAWFDKWLKNEPEHWNEMYKN